MYKRENCISSGVINSDVIEARRIMQIKWPGAGDGAQP
jgi:hypothetical protein